VGGSPKADKGGRLKEKRGLQFRVFKHKKKRRKKPWTKIQARRRLISNGSLWSCLTRKLGSPRNWVSKRWLIRGRTITAVWGDVETAKLKRKLVTEGLGDQLGSAKRYLDQYEKNAGLGGTS